MRSAYAWPSLLRKGAFEPNAPAFLSRSSVTFFDNSPRKDSAKEWGASLKPDDRGMFLPHDSSHRHLRPNRFGRTGDTGPYPPSKRPERAVTLLADAARGLA